MGEFQWTYQLNSTPDNSLAYATRFGWETRIPFLTRVLPGTGKSVPLAQPASFLQIKPENLLLVNMAPVEGERAVLLQLREIAGKKAVWGVSSSASKVAFKSTVCDLLGKALSDGDEIVFEPLESKFIKLTW
jgi:alpha-mannosidase